MIKARAASLLAAPLPWARAATLACLVLLASPTYGQQETGTGAVEIRSGDLVSVFGGTIRVPSNTLQRGSVVSIGGTVRIEGEVSQDVVVVLGRLELSGTVGGNVATVLAEQHVQHASVSGDLVNVMGSLELQDARISGGLVNILGSLERDAASLADDVVDVSLGSRFPSLWRLIFWARLFAKFLVFVLILLLVAVAPERIRLIGEHASTHYFLALLVGLLGYVGMFLILGVLSLTVVGIPIALLGFWVLKWLGIAGIFYAVGQGIGRWFGRELSLLGAVLLVFGVYAATMLTPSLLGIPGLVLVLFLSLLFFLLVAAPAIGLVILTRAGGRAYPSPAAMAAPPGPQAPAWTSHSGGMPPPDDSEPHSG